MATDFHHRNYEQRFRISSFLRFADPATEAWYERSVQYDVIWTLPLMLAGAALTHTVSVRLLALAGGYLLAESKGYMGRAESAVALTVLALWTIDPDGNACVSVFSYCLIGDCYSGFLTTWRRFFYILTVVDAVSFVFSWKPQLLVHIGTLLLLFVWEKQHRELWTQAQIANVQRAHWSELLNSQPTGTLLFDFSNSPIYTNPAGSSLTSRCEGIGAVLPESLKETVCKQGSAEVRFGDAENVAVFASGKRVPWFGRNCVLVQLRDVTNWVQTIKSLSKVDTKVLNELSTLERDISRRYRDTADLSAQLELCRMRSLLYEVNCLLAYERALWGKYEGTISACNVRAEVIDVVEFGSAGAENKGLSVVVAFEPGVPRSVLCDRVAVCSAFRYLYGRVISESEKSQQITINLRVASAAEESVKISVGMDAVTAGMKEISPLDDVEFSSFQTFLSSLNGTYSITSTALSTGLQRTTVRYDFTVQPHTNSGVRLLPSVSSVRRDLSADKCRWDFGAVGGTRGTIKRPSKSSARTNRGLPVIITTPQGLTQMVEVYPPQATTEDPAVPSELPETPFPECRSLQRNHNDLLKVSSSNTTSTGSSPISPSVRC